VTIGVVVPVTRPRRLPGIIGNFSAQTHEDRQLVLVLNGPARHVETPPLPSQCLALRVEGGTPARARNAGLDWLRVNGVELAAFWDDDDYYGPGYLAEAVALLRQERGRVCGKYVRFVRHDWAVHYMLSRQDGFLGGTICGWTQHLPDIPDLPLNEDREWCFAMRRTGISLISSGPLNYLYNRTAGAHAWHASPMQCLAQFGPALSLGDAPDSVVHELPDTFDFIPRPSLHDIGVDMLRALEARAN
jgi:hypothetical protein